MVVVNHRGGLERLPRLFLGQQLLGGLSITLFDRRKNAGHVVHGRLCGGKTPAAAGFNGNR